MPLIASGYWASWARPSCKIHPFQRNTFMKCQLEQGVCSFAENGPQFVMVKVSLVCSPAQWKKLLVVRTSKYEIVRSWERSKLRTLKAENAQSWVHSKLRTLEAESSQRYLDAHKTSNFFHCAALFLAAQLTISLLWTMVRDAFIFVTHYYKHMHVVAWENH